MENGKEDFINSVNLNINTDFPYLVLDVINDKSYPRNPGFQVMHWHEDLQFIYVLNGIIEVRTLDNAIRVQAGEAIFINKNVVHMVSRLGDCHYNSFIFPAYFLEFYPGSPAKIFVENITANEQLSVFRFSSLVDWHKDMTVILQQLVEIERNKTAFYAYEVLPAFCPVADYEKKHNNPARRKGKERKALSIFVCKKSFAILKNTTQRTLH